MAPARREGLVYKKHGLWRLVRGRQSHGCRDGGPKASEASVNSDFRKGAASLRVKGKRLRYQRVIRQSAIKIKTSRQARPRANHQPPQHQIKACDQPLAGDERGGSLLRSTRNHLWVWSGLSSVSKRRGVPAQCGGAGGPASAGRALAPLWC